jgi:glyoxylase I family protein
MDYTFTGDWPTLFDAKTDTLRSVFLGDPATPDTGIVELVVFEGATAPPPTAAGPTVGFFLVSLQREVDPTLARLGELGFTEGLRRISMPAPGGKAVQMAVITAPDGVRVELIGAAS